MSYYDNQSRQVVEWLTESSDDGIIRIATGFVDLKGLCCLIEAVPVESSVQILTGTALRKGQGSNTDLMCEFATELENSTAEGFERELRSLYEHLRRDVSIRGLPSLHAKLYLCETRGLVGSSNLTGSGLHAEFEYNTELSSEQHTTAVEWFDERWNDGQELTAEFIEAIESSDHGVGIVDVPITDTGRLSRVTGMSKETAENIANHSLAGQIARLDDEVEFFETCRGRPEHGLGTYGVEIEGSSNEYLTRLLIKAAKVRDAPVGFSETLNRLRQQKAPEHNDTIWRKLKAEGIAPELPVRPEGLAWYLEWYLRDQSLTDLPDDPSRLEPIEGPVLSLEPWRHQKQGIEEWIANNQRGIVEMATGTGKTIVGLNAIEWTYRELDRPGPIEILVTAHTDPLVEQWRDAIENHLGVTSNPDELDSSRDVVVRVVTPQKVINNFDEFSDREYDLVVVDEVHHYQNNVDGWGQVTKLNSSRILGLSAELSGEILQTIKKSIGPVVFEYSQEEAIDDGIVPEFNWQLHPVSLNEDEQEYHNKISKRIRITFDEIRSSSKTDELAREYGMQVNDLGDYFRLRARIESELPEKWKKLDSQIRKRRKIIYEAEKAIEHAGTLARNYADNGLKSIVFTMTTDTADKIAERVSTAMRLYHDLDQNTNDILEQFRQSDNGVLVGVKMLDEGIDVPEADVAINAAAEKTEKQLVQRQGRILRRNGHYVPIFHHFVVKEEIEYYSELGSIEPKVVDDPTPMIKSRLPTTVGTVDVWDVYRSLSPERLADIMETESLEPAGLVGDEWWLTIYRDEYPELFENRIEMDLSNDM